MSAAQEQASKEVPAEEEPVKEEGGSWTPVDVEAPLRRAVAAGAIRQTEAELILETEIDGPLDG